MNRIYCRKEKKEAKILASKVKQICQDYKDLYDNNYLNVSIDNFNVEYAWIASKVKHQSNKLGLPRHPGSIPGPGVSTFSFVIQRSDLNE